MKILALDIGAGTEDVLLYDDAEDSVENCIKMVLPSPTQVYAAKVREATEREKDLFVDGDIIGGGAFTFALKRHIESGLRVFMTEKAAYTVRNNLEEVKSLGINVVSGGPPSDFNGERLTIKEVNLEEIKSFLSHFNDELLDVDVVAIAVQDHGVQPEGTSNRRFRIQKIHEMLEDDPKPERLAFREDEVPECFLRMKSSVESSKRQMPNAKVLVMDTSPAAILGCLSDPEIKGYSDIIAVNVGNCHTMAALISNRRIIGLMEHHTHLMDKDNIEALLIDFADGKLSNEEVFNNGGHGLVFLEDPPGFFKIEKVAVTGPNRDLLAGSTLPVHFAAPAGDVMMTGTMGLVEAAKRRLL